MSAINSYENSNNNSDIDDNGDVKVSMNTDSNYEEEQDTVLLLLPCLFSILRLRSPPQW